jgi:hypothetical protein
LVLLTMVWTARSESAVAAANVAQGFAGLAPADLDAAAFHTNRVLIGILGS